MQYEMTGATTPELDKFVKEHIYIIAKITEVEEGKQ